MAFALELIVGKFSLNYFGPIVLSSVMGTFVARAIEGNNHELLANVKFGVTNPTEFILIALLGALTGLIGVIFSRGLYAFEDLMAKLLVPLWLKALLGGIFMGGILLVMPMVAGPAGWDAIRSLMVTEPTVDLAVFVLLLGITKLLATILSLGTGASGGLFAPSLLIGSAFGLAYGIGVNELLSQSQALHSPVSYALVGMGAFVAAITQAPLTAITIVFELTNRYEIVLPLIIALACSVVIYNHLVEGSIYTLKLMRRGINLQWGRDTGVLQSLKVSDILEKEEFAIDMHETSESILAKFKKSSRTSLPVIDDKKSLIGILGLYDMESWGEQRPEQFYNQQVSYIGIDDSLYEAFSKISSGDYSYLPVVDGAQMRLVGGIYRHRLLQAYRSALEFRGVIEKKEPSH
jgi:CIC family chloride channel protein